MPAIKLPEAAEKALLERAAAQQQRLAEAEAKFQSSELLSSLKQRSEENKAKYVVVFGDGIVRMVLCALLFVCLWKHKHMYTAYACTHICTL